MKLTVTQDSILAGLQMVNGVISGRSTLPILSNVLLEAKEDKMWLTGTDLEVTVRCSAEAKIEKQGATTLPARRLLNIIRELPGSEIALDISDKDVCSIACGPSFFKVVGLSSEDFPPLPQFEGKFSYTLEQGLFREMLQKTAYAASSDETRYILNGNLLSFRGDKLSVVGTDGRRLALVEHELEFPKEAEADITVPTKAVNELLHALHGEGALKIQATTNQVAFQFDDVLLLSKLIEGTYPNFRQVIPSRCEERVAIERELLLNALRRVALLTSEKSNSIRMAFSKNKLEISAVTPDVGEAHETIPVKYGGKDVCVAFNPDYVIDPLRNLDSDEVFFEMTDEFSPGVVKCDVPFIYVLMPMRVS